MNWIERIFYDKQNSASFQTKLVAFIDFVKELKIKLAKSQSRWKFKTCMSEKGTRICCTSKRITLLLWSRLKNSMCDRIKSHICVLTFRSALFACDGIKFHFCKPSNNVQNLFSAIHMWSFINVNISKEFINLFNFTTIY